MLNQTIGEDRQNFNVQKIDPFESKSKNYNKLSISR